jgi:signal transduction histidine kinase
LLSNAVKFTPAGGRIALDVRGDEKQVTMTVTDTGQGIDEQFLPFVFDRFRQEEGGFARSQGGLGLGLSIVRYIVEGHGGTISVASQGRGFGSTFTVILPKVSQLPETTHLRDSAP